MNEDFRAKNIGQPASLFRRDTLHCSVEGRAEMQRYLSKRRLELSGRPFRSIFGARISDDYGKTWRLLALCGDCIKQVEPPRMLKNEGTAGAMNCDWCNALNVMFQK